MPNVEDIQSIFFNKFNIEKLKKLATEALKDHAYDYDFLQENGFNDVSKYKGDTRKLEIIYRGITIHFRGDLIQGKPFFRILYSMIDPATKSEYFRYDLEFNNEGDILDDYFYIPSLD
ncbi:hypothetical protein FUAX_55060 (plasmid) [Fulvitalea axinellae]|uniref:DUF3887 domain-containing protein n=1 Tax=Fulvitalea axinellae TaxID=1182444 RepID=A0AAU9D3C1_9BACT|nr:hypothetical protein FUAX_55060 [Fulvitalea axinellae]